jgi:predicted amidohydrolase YtcJ
VRGDALDPRKLVEKRYPTRWELDSVAPDHAVVLLGVGNHAIAANSLALARAGIDRSTEDPPGGKVDRDADGEPTGVLRELGKLRLDPNRPDCVLPGPSQTDRLEAVAAAFGHLHQAGVTAIHDVVMDPAEIRAYMDLHGAGRLGVRVRFLVRGYEARTSLDHVLGLGLRQGFGDAWLQYTGIKLSIDGACGERNAATYEPYPGEPDNTGLIRIPQDKLDDLVRRCHVAEQRIAIHAIGPRAVDMALDAFERAFEGAPRGTLRHRIEHAYLPPTPKQLERIAAAELIVSTQPSFFWDGDGWTDIWRVEDLTGVMPIRAMLDHGVRVAGGTDYPCVPVEPLPGLGSLVTRRSMDGALLDPAQAITMEEALRLQTVEAAYAGYDERLLGTFEVGKAGDLVVLSGDPLTAAPADVGGIRADLTVVDGRVVYERGTA